MDLGQEITNSGNPIPSLPPIVTDSCAEKLQNSLVMHFQAFGEYFGGSSLFFPTM